MLEGKLGGQRLVMTIDHAKGGDHDGDEEHYDPGAVAELGRGNNHGDHRGHRRSYAIDGEPPSPAGTTLDEPVPHHARLGQGEGDEHAHRVEWDEGVRLAPEEHDEEGGQPS